MNFGIFRSIVVLFFLSVASFAQTPTEDPVIELDQTIFSIERPFTISVVIPNSENRVTVSFPDITGFTKKGVSTSLSPVETGGKTITNQIIRQTYQALAPGRYRLRPFSLSINGELVYSEGATLLVQPSASALAADEAALKQMNAAAKNAAFLSLRASKSTVYTGEGVALTLSFFVADNYPYILNFSGLNKQLQTITKKIRPINAWEENEPINELKPVSVSINGKKFREIRLYKSIFFPLSNQPIRLPAVSLQLNRPRPKIGPPEAQAETVTFSSQPLSVAVRSLPAHPLRGRVPVGLFQLEENLDKRQVNVEQSVRYTFTIIGEGNIATLSAPTILTENAQLNVFPPEEKHSVIHNGNQVSGSKTFSYFIVAHQNGDVSLANCFQWIYFDPQTARYDTLHPRTRLFVGTNKPLADNQALTPGTRPETIGETEPTYSTDRDLYKGIETLNSTNQPINLSVLFRAAANVLILIMLVGMIFIFFKKQDTDR